MGKNSNKKQQISKREEEQGKRTFRNICIGLIVIGILMGLLYAFAL